MMNVLNKMVVLPALVMGAALLLLAGLAFAEPHSPGASDKTAELIWGKEVNGRYVLFYSLLENDRWQEPVQLTSGDRTSLVPTIAAGRSGETVAAWSYVLGENTFLEFAVLEGGRIQSGPGRIETGMRANLGAFLAVDGNGVPWLVWSGNNGTPSDIFYSVRRNGRWLPPQRVHPANDVPDIMPELETGTGGEMIVHWKSITPAGEPAVYSKTLSVTEAIFSRVEQRRAVGDHPITGSYDCIGGFPSEARDLDRAVLLSHCGGESPPVQTRFLGKVLRRQTREAGRAQ